MGKLFFFAQNTQNHTNNYCIQYKDNMIMRNRKTRWDGWTDGHFEVVDSTEVENRCDVMPGHC